MSDIDLDAILSGEHEQARVPTLQERLEKRLYSDGNHLTGYWPRNKDKKILVCVIAKLLDSALVFAPAVSAMTGVGVAHDRNVATSAAVVMPGTDDVGSLFVVAWDSLVFPHEYADALNEPSENVEPRP